MANTTHTPSIEELLADVPLTDPASIPPDGDDGQAFAPQPEPQEPPPAGTEPGPPMNRPSPAPGGHPKLTLTKAQRVGTRNRAVRAAALALVHSANVRYTQGPERWEGLQHRLVASKGQYPRAADCSSFATWCIWNGLRMYGAPDVVNNAGWKAGFTGTQLNCGTRVTGKIMRGDLAIYGSGPPGKHVAICIGDGLVISHGSDRGPFKLKLHYRDDLMEVRRYF
jgi:cell wall-associated NlpC family hydrolase